MKYFILVALTALVTISLVESRIVCGPHSCDRFKNEEVVTQSECEANTGKIFLPKGGWCGCVPTCVSKRFEGESCRHWFVGVPANFACDHGLTCESNICVKA